MKYEDIDNIAEDMCKAITMSPYEAVDVFWVALVKFANLFPGKEEYDRIKNLVDQLSTDTINYIISNPKIDTLLKLDPPLETVINSPHERLESDKTKLAIKSFYKNRDVNPKEALLALGEILKRIRNKRAHGFKTRSGPRDQEILSATKDILKSICETVAEELSLKSEVSKS